MKSVAAADHAMSEESELNSDKMLEAKLEQALEPLVEPSKRHAVVQSVEMIVSEELYAGPLPHPEHFRRYQEVEPSAPDRILTMAESELEYQQRKGWRNLNADIASHFCGLALGFVVCMSLIVGAIYLGSLGYTAVPLALLGATAVSAVTIFVNSSRKRDQARETPPPPPISAKPPAKTPAKPPAKTPAKPPTKPRNRRR